MNSCILESKRCSLWNNSEFGIVWQLIGEPMLSVKDQAGVAVTAAEVFGL